MPSQLLYIGRTILRRTLTFVHWKNYISTAPHFCTMGKLYFDSPQLLYIEKTIFRLKFYISTHPNFCQLGELYFDSPQAELQLACVLQPHSGQLSAREVELKFGIS